MLNLMMLLTLSWKLDVLILVGIGIYMLYRHINKSFTYWTRRNIYSPKTVPIFGHFRDVVLCRLALGELLKKYYNKTTEKYFGLYLFNEPFLVVKDPEIIRNILIKDFSYFTDRAIAVPKHDSMQQHLLFLAKGSTWRFVRTRLVPTFTSGRLKTVFSILDGIGNDLQNWLSNNLGEHEARSLAARYASDAVAKTFYDDHKCAGMAYNVVLAGVETISSAVSFTLYEFCLNTDIQNKARHQVQTVLKKYEELSYEAVKEMTYLRMCIYETARKYPVLPFLDRKCNKDYNIPGTDVVLEKGTPVLIPLYALQMDEQYFSEPLKYNPERFLDKIVHQKGGYYMPFGNGPRMCIGERFGILASMIALIHILKHFEVEKCNQTPDDIKFDARSFMFISKVGLPMRFKALKQVKKV